MLDYIQKFGKIPIIVTGDLNSDPTDLSLSLFEEANLKNVYF